MIGCHFASKLLGYFVLLSVVAGLMPVHGQVKSLAVVNWQSAEKSFDVSVEGMPVEAFLKRLTRATGWQVLVQPGLEKNITVEFKGLPQGEALKMMFGELSYALMRPTNQPPKLYIYQSSLADATKVVQGERPPNWIENEVILRMSPETKMTPEQLARQLGGKIIGSSTNLNAYRIEFPDAATAESARQVLAQNPNGRAEDNFQWTRPEASPDVNASEGMNFGVSAKDVTPANQLRVALIDTAVQPLEGKQKEFMLPTINLAGEPTLDPATPSHGTSMAQHVLNSMAGITKANETSVVRIQPYDVYGSSGATTTFDVANALNLAVGTKPHAINLSLGGEGTAPYLEEPIAVATRNGIPVFASAGNSPTTDPVFPAASPYAIAVTATDPYGNIAPYANRGSFIDLKAPGSLPTQFNGKTYVSTGTSTSTAFISGQYIALRAKGFNADEAVNLLRQHYDVSNPPQAAHKKK
ncbi:MAG: S8 family peptidase [Verrucomicrobiales bacterium]